MLEGLGTVASALLALGLVAVAVALSLYERLETEDLEQGREDLKR